MTTSANDRTVGFFDLAETSAPAQADETGRQHMQRRLDLMASAVREKGGRVIKQIGDELMCDFAAPATAVGIARELAAELDAFDQDGAAVSLRVGLHHGPVLEEDGDIFGDTVNIAARMTSIASPGQIITTEEIVCDLPEDARTSVKLFDEVRVKGSARTRPIYRVLWAPRAETLGHTQMPALRTRTTSGVLTLHHASGEFRLEHRSEEFRLGRDSRCELVVRSEMASRFHAVVEARGGKFLLRDQSTNGTWVRMQDSPVVTLQREELPLFGEGVISLGEAVGRSPKHLIRFTCF